MKSTICPLLSITETIEFHVANDGDVSLSLSSVYIEGSTNFTVPSYSESITENDWSGIVDNFKNDSKSDKKNLFAEIKKLINNYVNNYNNIRDYIKNNAAIDTKKDTI